MAVKLSVASANQVYTTRYDSFRGVDFSKDATQVDRDRASFALNMISDPNGYPEKRWGWRTMCQVEQPVNGIFYGEISSVPYLIIHGGTKLYRWDRTNAPVLLQSGINNKKSTMFSMNNKIWILTGAEYLVFDGTTVKSAAEEGYIATTLSARPVNSKTGGTEYESVNLVARQRAITFKYDGDMETGIAGSVYPDTPDANLGVVGNVVYQQFYYMGKDGQWHTWAVEHYEIRSYTDEEGVEWKYLYYNDNRGYYTIDINAPETFKLVYYLKDTAVAANLEKIASCNLAVCYGAGQNNRIFVSGNPDEPNVDRYSEPNDPAWFPEPNYSVVGTEETPIIGYSKMGEYLAIHKKANLQDTTIFLRSGVQLSDGSEVFPIRQGIAGIGAVSPNGIGMVNDEPMILTNSGIYSIVSTNIASEKTARNRSFYLDSKLTKEPDLNQAVVTAWGDLFLACVNGHGYVLDTRMRSYVAGGSTYVYDGYYWDNIPAIVFLELDQELYFGTSDGKICKFNTDQNGVSKYNDDGSPICAQLLTKADDDGSFMTLKTLCRRGCGIMIKPYARASVRVSVITDRDFAKEIQYAVRDLFDWEDIRFERFSFCTKDTAQIIPLHSKVKHYATLQFLLENKELNEGFGVFGIEKRFTTAYYKKG